MIRHFTASAVVLDGDRVLLLDSAKGPGWIYPGGHLEPGEDPAQAVVREVREEAGLEIELLAEQRFAHPAVGVIPTPFAILDVAVQDARIGPHRHLDAVYAARPRSGEVVLNAEARGYRWVPLDDVADLPMPEELPDLIAAAARYAAALSR
ncbi:NUDIX hydrolase [Planomonospora sp. ID82291]|uniref:NUDIX hydrolase n=1 Tax=Planomonospora sp. ID82291 TaxID=2738136 RepID=UPI0018C3F37F|nr:NUDIX domain-containing protein [Planomonospora sp. ID82291]MBG0818657.1 NUDIX domain-containing protein [Planomonospora sp. ID82291]